MRISIAHATTVHQRGDIRISKQINDLKGNFGPIALVVFDGKGDQELEGFRIIDVGRCGKSRFYRVIVGPWRVFRGLRKLSVQVIHFHDPELIPVGMLLRILGRQVIYDVHEDVPRQILSKDWIPRIARKPVAWLMEGLEWIASRAFSAILAATPPIASRFPGVKTVVVQNFPILEEFRDVPSLPYGEREKRFIYVGAITQIRGAIEMVEAIGTVGGTDKASLYLAGNFSPTALESSCRLLPGWKWVEYRGWHSRGGLAEAFGNSRAGLVLLHPERNYLESYPTKLFEYMAAGLPVIVSDFPLWREIINSCGCGLLVDPLDPKAISRAMVWILENPEEAEAMGLAGQRAVQAYFNWTTESEKLLDLYRCLLDTRK